MTSLLWVNVHTTLKTYDQLLKHVCEEKLKLFKYTILVYIEFTYSVEIGYIDTEMIKQTFHKY